MTRLLVLLILIATASPMQAGVLAAARTLPAGTVLTAADLRAIDSDRPGLNDPSAIIGRQTRVTIYEGRPFQAGLLQTPRLVSRNQIVRLSFQRGTLRIDTQGRALSEGGEGEVVRVMNVDSRNTINARVQPDGSLLVMN